MFRRFWSSSSVFSFRGRLACALVIAFNCCQGREVSQPIVDVRISSPFRQIDSSFGDEWAPTWGGDDVLYTSNDDGTSFGGVETSAIAFGKLEGGDPFHLKASTIDALDDFRESEPGPENAMWKTTATVIVNETLYRFSPCDRQSGPVQIACLLSSTDSGRTWTRNGRGTVLQSRGGIFDAPAFIVYSNQMKDILGLDQQKYIYAASYRGVHKGEEQYLVGRVLRSRLPVSNFADWSFLNESDIWVNDVDRAVLTANSHMRGKDNANWKATNIYSVDGILYMFISRCHYPWQSGDSEFRHVFKDSSVIKSIDHGRSWSPSARDNLDRPMFPGKRFGAPYFVWYGKDGAADVDGADSYVYAVSNNGYFEGGDNYVLGRVPRSKLSNLSAKDWSFYISGDGSKDINWTSKLEQSEPILFNPLKSGMTGMTYVEALHRYVMVLWHYSKVSFLKAIQARDLSTVLDFFEAPHPWGPWSRVKSFATGRLGWYAPILGQKFQAAEGTHRSTAIVYATGFASRPEGGLDPALYKLNYFSITLSSEKLPSGDSSYVGEK